MHWIGSTHQATIINEPKSIVVHDNKVITKNTTQLVAMTEALLCDVRDANKDWTQRDDDLLDMCNQIESCHKKPVQPIDSRIPMSRYKYSRDMNSHHFERSIGMQDISRYKFDNYN